MTDTSGAVVGTNRITRVANGCGLGLYLRLSGGLEDGAMVLSGERDTPRGKVLDRISWSPLADGRVRQHWEVSRDGGESWQTVFDGMYSRGSR